MGRVGGAGGQGVEMALVRIVQGAGAGTDMVFFLFFSIGGRRYDRM